MVNQKKILAINRIFNVCFNESKTTYTHWRNGKMMRQFFTLWLFFFVCVLFGCEEAGGGAETVPPGIHVRDDMIAEPEAVTLTSVGTDGFDEATFKHPLEQTFNLEVYELSPGVYQFVNDPA